MWAASAPVGVTGVTGGPIFRRQLPRPRARNRPVIPVTERGARAALGSPRPLPEARMPDPQPTPGRLQAAQAPRLPADAAVPVEPPRLGRADGHRPGLQPRPHPAGRQRGGQLRALLRRHRPRLRRQDLPRPQHPGGAAPHAAEAGNLGYALRPDPQRRPRALAGRLGQPDQHRHRQARDHRQARSVRHLPPQRPPRT